MLTYLLTIETISKKAFPCQKTLVKPVTHIYRAVKDGVPQPANTSASPERSGTYLTQASGSPLAETACSIEMLSCLKPSCEPSTHSSVSLSNGNGTNHVDLVNSHQGVLSLGKRINICCALGIDW